MADLGRWLNGDYRIPGAAQDDLRASDDDRADPDQASPGGADRRNDTR
jgi:endogenous inhibitor of DNA gyrase (YacG/DUF329 family)